MRTYAVDEDHETDTQKARRLIDSYARTGLGIDDIQVRLKLKLKHGIALGRNAIKCLVLKVPR